MRVVSILALCLCALVSPHAQTPSLVFVNVAVVPMDRDVVLRGQTVVVRGDRIVELGLPRR